MANLRSTRPILLSTAAPSAPFPMAILLMMLLTLLAYVPSVEATVTVDDNGVDKHLPSRLDRKIGLGFHKGFEYRGHLQYIRSNLRLCGTRTHNITVPHDAISVALIVKSGGCSLAEKARVASTQIYPPDKVQFIIVDGDKALQKNDAYAINSYIYMPDLVREPTADNNVNDEGDGMIHLRSSASPQSPHSSQDRLVDNSIFQNDSEEQHPNKVEWENVDDDDVNDDESTMLEVDRVLRTHRKKSRHHDERVSVAILHVSYTTGYFLLDYVIRQPQSVRDAGGPVIHMDSEEPEMSNKTIFLWVLLSASLSASACCCLMLAVRTGMFEEPPPPPRPQRRRLTNQQVRENYPHFPYSETDCPCDGELHECSICLDEYEIGARMRRLPCEHVFHANCIARWLVERSATCPLCKVDLFEDEEEDEANETGEADPLQQPPTAAAATETNQNVPDWLNRRILNWERELLRRQQERGTWWERLTGRTPRRTNSGGTAPAVVPETTTTAETPVQSRTQGDSWLTRFLRNPTRLGSPAVTELTEPLLQPEDVSPDAPVVDSSSHSPVSDSVPQLNQENATVETEPVGAEDGPVEV